MFETERDRGSLTPSASASLAANEPSGHHNDIDEPRPFSTESVRPASAEPHDAVAIAICSTLSSSDPSNPSRSSADRLVLALAVMRRTTFSTGVIGRDLAPGEIVAIDPSRFYRIGDRDAVLVTVRLGAGSAPGRLLPTDAFHGVVIPRAAAAMLAAFLLANTDSGAALAPPMARAAAAMVEALLGALMDTPPALPGLPAPAEPAAMKRNEILAFIAAHAACADLTPEQIARRTGVSRTTLYRILKPLGGVATCVQQHRLRMMRTALAHRGDTRSVEAIAYDSGFRSATHASRSFHKAFGMAPGSFRQAGPTI